MAGARDPDEVAPPRGLAARIRAALARPPGQALRLGLAAIAPTTAPLDLRFLGRVLLHAALVGVVAGVLGGGFFAVLELGQRLLLEGVAGYTPLRARGETFLTGEGAHAFLPWALALLPALGGLASGLLTWRLAPEAAGGGGEATIEAYHRGGIVRRRVVPVKAVAAVLALCTGGAGGREGPTMQIGAGIGALVGRWLPTSRRERRALYVAGIAAGIAAVFRTPLGAALLATEMLYRDDFEADALVPAILASVVSYAVVISAFGETTLFGTLPRFPFVPAHLLLFAGLALVVSLTAVAFVQGLRIVQRAAAASGLPAWLRPAVGGLAMGLVGTGAALFMARMHGAAAARMGVFGGGYGVAQVAIDGGAPWLPHGWALAGLLLGLAFAKLVAASLTVGSGAAAGDFAPSLVVGGLVGGAFGHAARLLLHDPRIAPGAFALVGMGTFYGGIANAPLSALVLVSELAGSYDLLVPMMLATGIAYVALRHWSLYPGQRASRAASPVHAQLAGGDADAVLEHAGALARAAPPELGPVPEATPLASLSEEARRGGGQRVCTVLGADGAPKGLLDLGLLADLGPMELSWTRAADASVPFVALGPDATLRDAADLLARVGLPQVPILVEGRVAGWIGERELARAYLRATQRDPPPAGADG